MKRLTLNYCFILLLLQVTGGVGAAPQGEILSDEIAPSADTSVLMAEANLFETIRKGIALAIAQCEGIDICVPDANRVEVERIIGTLDTRISSLSQRHEDTGDVELEAILIAYADARDGYSKFVEKLGTISTEDEEAGLGDDFGDDFLGEDVGEAAGVDEQFEVFRDFDDEELVDEEEDLEDLEDLEDEPVEELE